MYKRKKFFMIVPCNFLGSLCFYVFEFILFSYSSFSVSLYLPAPPPFFILLAFSIPFLSSIPSSFHDWDYSGCSRTENRSKGKAFYGMSFSTPYKRVCICYTDLLITHLFMYIYDLQRDPVINDYQKNVRTKMHLRNIPWEGKSLRGIATGKRSITSRIFRTRNMGIVEMLLREGNSCSGTRHLYLLICRADAHVSSSSLYRLFIFLY